MTIQQIRSSNDGCYRRALQSLLPKNVTYNMVEIKSIHMTNIKAFKSLTKKDQQHPRPPEAEERQQHPSSRLSPRNILHHRSVCYLLELEDMSNCQELNMLKEILTIGKIIN